MTRYVVTVERYIRETTKFQIHAETEEQARQLAINHAEGAGSSAVWMLAHPMVTKDTSLLKLKKLPD